MAYKLQIELFGGFQITLDGEMLSGFHQHRLQALLAYLILHRDRPQPRQTIAFLFWPDSSDKQAQVNLRKLLFHLKK